ncbi:MAG: metal-dependent hydrolase [Chitinophagaceae bacterium]|nr:metal-dependent hydrolase [Chitinophagaceae bacterium]
MDSFTHIALGACLGEAFIGKKIGKKALIWGAIAQSVPDIDFVSSFWMDTPSYLLAHRGFTHSLFFCLLITPFFALIADRIHKPHNIRFSRWIIFFGVVILLHILIDAFNNYGVGWFEPFSHKRISINAIYVADPFFSIWSFVGCLALLWLKPRAALRKKCWAFGLSMSSFYLLYCLFNKSIIDRDTREILQSQKITHTRYLSTPAPLQNWLWYIVAGNDSGYYIGFRSLFDKKKEMHFEYFPRNDSFIQHINRNEELEHLIRFSQQFYTVEKWGDTLVLNDLRFGQMLGWQSPRAKFVFHYYLSQPGNNKLVVQRGRFEGWQLQTANSLLQRIRGD